MNLRYAYNTNGCANHRLSDALALIADSGYDGVALTLDFQHLDPFAPDYLHQAEQLANELASRKLGMVVETGARFLLDPYHKHEPTLLHPDAEGRAKRIDFLRRAMEICALCGGEAVSFWAGVPQTNVSRTQAMCWLIEGVDRLLEIAELYGVTLAFEPEPGMLIETAHEYEKLRVHLRTGDALTLALDTGHCLVTGDIEPHDAVKCYAAALGTVAIEDMRRGEHVHLPFGEGDMDMPKVLSALKQAAFGGLVCIELSRESHRAHQAIPEAIAYLKQAEATIQLEAA